MMNDKQIFAFLIKNFFLYCYFYVFFLSVKKLNGNYCGKCGQIVLFIIFFAYFYAQYLYSQEDCSFCKDFATCDVLKLNDILLET